MTVSPTWVGAYAVLWFAVIAELIAVLLLARLLREFILRLRGLEGVQTYNGPQLHAPAPVIRLKSLQGARVTVGGPKGIPSVVLFVSTTCSVCKELVSAMPADAFSHSRADMVVVSTSREMTEDDQHYARRFSSFGASYVIGAQVARAYQVPAVPYLVTLDDTGRVLSKGEVTSVRELQHLLAEVPGIIEPAV